MSNRNLACVVAGLAAWTLVATACGSDPVGTTDPTATAGATTSAPADATTAAPTTTTESTTTQGETDVPTPTVVGVATTLVATTTTTTTTGAPAATTTTTRPALTAADLTLTESGVFPFLFGDDDATVISGLTTALGPPDFDGAQTYPIVDGEFFLDATEQEGFTHPVGRNVCYPNGLCAQFGGDTVDTLTFTGWQVSDGFAPQPTTAEGITVGSVLSDFPGAVDVGQGGCYSVGYGDASGVELTLLSAGQPFLYFDEEGNFVLQTPAVEDLSVLSLVAGDLPYFLFDDC